MADPDRDHAPAAANHQRWKKPVHMVEARHVEKGGAGEQLQAAAGIGRAVAKQPAAHRIGDPRGQALRQAVVTLGAPTGHQHPVAHLRRFRAQTAEQSRNVGGIVLPVAVERGDDRRPRGLHAAGGGLALAAALPVAHHAQAQISRPQFAQTLRRRILAAVIHIDDFEGAHIPEGGLDLGDQGS